MSFEKEYGKFMETHFKQREGERLRRLKEGHAHGEKLFLENVWWPAFRQFDYLHPEYEVKDFKEGYRYLDFAYIRPNFQLAIEIDGFGPHLRNLSRWQFADQLIRQNHLIIDGWKLLRFSYDDVKERPRLCQQAVQQLFGRWLGEGPSLNQATMVEKEIIRLAIRLGRPITPKDVCESLHVERRYAGRLLRNLSERKWLYPSSGDKRVRSYRLHGEYNFVL